MSSICAALLALLLLPTLVLAQDRITGRAFATRSPVLGRHGMAATSQPLATQVALDVLKAGGSAVDAAIAANAMLGLVEPTGCGLGGDLFAIVWDAQSRSLVGLNGSGRSPRGLDLAKLREVLRDQGRTAIPPYGPLPVSVPGCADGWFMLHERFGKLPMAEVLAPAIAYAEEGAPISQVIAHYWALGVERLGEWPGFLETFAPGGHAPAHGELFANPRLARTYRALVEGGRDAFYRGEIARVIAKEVQDRGGFLAYEDLAEHRGEWVEPVSVDYRGYRVWELPPNGQGIAALQMLNLLEGYDLAAMGYGSADYAHVFIEAKKLAFEDRARFYADPAMAAVPVSELISKSYAKGRRALIDGKRARKVVPPGDPKVIEEGDTVYLCVADGAGNMVSLIQSNYRGMGSGITPPGLGFCLQDRGQLFALDEGHANVYAPGKRPFHTIIPAFLTRDGEPLMAFGVMGGATQPQGHVQIVVNMIDFGMNVQEAGDAPRLLHQGSSQPTGEVMTDGGTVFLEHGFADWEVVRELRRKGHEVSWNVGGFGGYQGIWRDGEQGVLYGASESRKDGHAAGY
jgi:gamma-glutamyltranspeptidase / glutathione hydrolase